MKEDHEKQFTIIVNGRAKVVTERKLTYAQIVALAFDNPPTGENVAFTITYRKGEGNKPEGTLVEGETVKIKEGMIFNVTATNKS
ncbi:MAG: multiubiquitin domain-containing protein [Nitrospira sp.]|nr:multiubiquitin domain-containing protein [Nitrospira sp.]